MSELTQQDYARLRAIGQFDTLEAQYFALRARLEAVEGERDKLVKRCDEKSECISNDTNRFIVVTHRIKELCPEATSLENGIERLQQQLAAVTQERDEAIENMKIARDMHQNKSSSLAAAEGRIKEFERQPVWQARYKEQVDTLTTRVRELEALSVIDRQANDEYREIRAANLAVIHTLTAERDRLAGRCKQMEEALKQAIPIMEGSYAQHEYADEYAALDRMRNALLTPAAAQDEKHE